MVQALVDNRIGQLEERLRNGAQLLFDCEQRGEMDGRYPQWLAAWQTLLREYEQLQAEMAA